MSTKNTPHQAESNPLLNIDAGSVTLILGIGASLICICETAVYCFWLALGMDLRLALVTLLVPILPLCFAMLCLFVAFRLSSPQTKPQSPSYTLSKSSTTTASRSSTTSTHQTSSNLATIIITAVLLGKAIILI